MNPRMARIPFALEDRLAQAVRRWHESIFAGIEEETFAIAGQYGFSRKGRILVADAAPMGLIRRLADLIGKRGEDAAKMRVRLNKELLAAERGWFTRFFQVGQAEAKEFLKSMSIPAAQVFEGRLEEMRALYLDSAVERALGEQDDLKASFLLKLNDWAEGRAEKLDVSDLVMEMQETSARRAKFFARDQYSRFERSLAVSTLQAADAPYVEVLNSNDTRVRPSHRNAPEGWGRTIYRTEAITQDPRWKDFNCRCAFVGRWDLSADQERRLVA